MKIGILTFQNAINYGAILQAYALQKKISTLDEDYTVEIIDYKQRQLEKQYSPFFIEKDSNIKNKIRFLLYFVVKYKKFSKFNKFISQNLNFSKKIKTGKDIDHYDVIFVGSDQVWNLEITDNDTTFLLDFVKKNSNTKKVSYAASVGKNHLLEAEVGHFKKWLPTFNGISVREENAIEIVSPYTSLPIYEVLDPTLLLEKKQWLKLVNNENKEGDYILVYCLESNTEMDKIIDFMSKKMNLKVLEIMPRGNSLLNRIYPKNIYGPQDFLRLFYNAKYIITNSFHGTVFSIIFEKKFITVPHKTRGSRMKNLLTKTGLTSRLVSTFNENEIESLLDEPNFIDCNKYLNEKRNFSEKFIKDNLI
ncbi:polysaccharide pyruvyl transferase family protein [Enterococcus gallinarum]|uniref:polysaccharide pyruvyl transferase family protein n=1 Tax=Enterococcus gallinarum TaxID=1353 RepID=UPI002954DB51|nr:polysaccharide pyruvyl transferase family protein [Enterococcus gallinarum]MDV7785566.1 polysaccharide pyruvyl transferase family protein [Enterococcus gallinarum]